VMVARATETYPAEILMTRLYVGYVY